ncbi:MAG: 4'-phosphopantetheinyl transferase family protein [Thermomonas sp.]
MSDPNGLREAFAAVLPADWRGSIGARTLVALILVEPWAKWIDAATLQLQPSERLRVERQRFLQHRRERTLAYVLHRLFLAECLGCEPEAVPLRRDDLGCPCVDVPDIRTSLSHANGAIAMAMACGGPVGVDIEAATRDAAMDEIAERIWHPREAIELAPLVGPERRKALLALWVRKEAVLKARGVGLVIEMTTFMTPIDGLTTLPQDAEPILCRQIAAGEDWVAAVACNPLMSVEYRWLRPTG